MGTALIDEFAIAALPAIIAGHCKNNEYSYKNIAEEAYNVAEAMMEQRLKRTTSRYGKKKS
jgi:hypothetical protein